MSPIAAAYRSAEYKTVSQRDLIVKLYVGIERFVAKAADGISGGDRELAHANCQKAKAIIIELLSTLDLKRGGEVATRLQGLYVFFLGRISEGNLKRDPQKLREILPLVADLRSAWEQVPEELAGDAEGRGAVRMLV